MNIKTILPEDRNVRGHAAMTVAYVIFGLNMIISKNALASGTVSPGALTIYRMTGAAAFFWIASLFVKREKILPRDFLLMFFASLLGITLNQSLFIIGLSKTSAINASIISTLVPLLTMILAALYLKEPITWKKAVGVLLGMTGAVMLIMVGKSSFSWGNISGDLFCLGSCISFACYLTFFRDLIRRYTPITLMKWLFLFAALCLLPFDYRELDLATLTSHSQTVMWDILYVVFFATFVTYLLLPIGQQNLRPTIVSMYNYVQPLVASVVSVAIGLDTFGWKKTVAAALVFTGVWLAARSKSRAQIDSADS